MRRHLPSWGEAFVFAALSFVFAVFVSALERATHDLGLSFFAMPLFVGAAVMGLRRNWSRSDAGSA